MDGDTIQGTPAETAAVAADALREQLDLLEAAAAEDAWARGIADARNGQTPLGEFTSQDGAYANFVYDDDQARRDLAARIGLDADPAHPAVEAAALAYADGYEEAAGEVTTVFPLPYKPGEAVTTGRGKKGILTGGSTSAGHPLIRFADGIRPVPRSAILGPVAFQFLRADAARQAVARSTVIQDGDVLLVGTRAVIQAGGRGPLTVKAASAAGPGRYDASVRLARRHTGRTGAGDTAASSRTRATVPKRRNLSQRPGTQQATGLGT